MDAKTTFKFTKRAIDRLPAPDPSGQQMLYWDSELKGFGVRVSGKSNGKSYVAQRRLGDGDGRTRRMTIGACNEVALDKARDEAADFLHVMRKGKDPKARSAGAGVTLQGALDDYLAKKTKLSERTRADYRLTIERYLSAWLTTPLLKITPAMVQARHTAIQNEVERSDEVNAKRWLKITGTATADAAMRVFGALWNHTAREIMLNDSAAILPQNPTLVLKERWFRNPPRERMVRPDDLATFYAAVDALRNRTHRDYLMLLLFTGMRRGEAASLKWGDIDFALRVIRVSAFRTKAKRKLDLPMSDFVHGLLVARQNLGRAAEFVFPANSASGHVEEPKQPLGLVQEACGLRASAHDLRRTFLTVAEATDISGLALKALVNHALPKDTTTGYIGMVVERLREPAQRVADRLKELCGIGAANMVNVAKLG